MFNKRGIGLAMVQSQIGGKKSRDFNSLDCHLQRFLFADYSTETFPREYLEFMLWFGLEKMETFLFGFHLIDEKF